MKSLFPAIIFFFHSFCTIETLDLSYSFLSGTLPRIMGSITTLKQLNLENNALRGTIPDEFAYMTSLSK